MTRVLSFDKETGAPIIRTVNYSIPQYNIGDIVSLKKGKIVTIVEIHFTATQDSKGPTTDVFYVDETDGMFDEVDVARLITGADDV